MGEDQRRSKLRSEERRRGRGECGGSGGSGGSSFGVGGQFQLQWLGVILGGGERAPRFFAVGLL
jgi:hypothetical protein